MTVSWCALTKVVLVCAVPFQFTVAFAAKLLPLTTKLNAGPPEVMLGGASWVIAGIAPGCGAAAALELYPHASVPAISPASNTIGKVFIMVSPGRLPIRA